MGYGTRNDGSAIRTYWPEDTATTMYINPGLATTVYDILSRTQRKWPGTSLEDLSITTEHIQTNCIGYDRYDPNDYTTFIVIELIDQPSNK